jgi:hypothetical protein
MRRSRHSWAIAGRTFVALVCALALTLGCVGLSQARGAKGTQPSRSAPMLIFVQPATAQAPAAICPYALLFAGEIAQQAILERPGAETDAVSYALADEAVPSSRMDETPLRPPRMA